MSDLTYPAHAMQEACDAARAALVRAEAAEAEVARQSAMLRAIEDSHLDPARALIKADTLAGAAILRAHVAEAEVARLRSALGYITAPTMGLHSGIDPERFAREDASDAAVRTALAACIRTATLALRSPAEGSGS